MSPRQSASRETVAILHAAATLSLLAAASHLRVVPEHLEEWWGYGAYFLVPACRAGTPARCCCWAWLATWPVEHFASTQAASRRHFPRTAAKNRHQNLRSAPSDADDDRISCGTG